MLKNSCASVSTQKKKSGNLRDINCMQTVNAQMANTGVLTYVIYIPWHQDTLSHFAKVKSEFTWLCAVFLKHLIVTAAVGTPYNNNTNQIQIAIYAFFVTN